MTTRFTEAQMVLIFAFFGLLIGGIIREIYKKIKVPYALCMILFSVLFGSISDRLSWIGETMDVITGTDPHLIMTIFLVPVVFESAWDADGFVMQRNKVAIFLVSFPAAILSAILYGLVFRYVFYYYEE